MIISLATPSSRIALVTGGEGGLATALRTALQATGITVLAPGRQQLDVTCKESISSYFAKIDRLDLLINNAGCIRDNRLGNLSEEDWDVVLDTNLKGTFLCAQAASPLMARQREGHIIQIGSFSALGGNIGQSNYAAAKAGVIGLTKSLAREFGKRNVRVNCVLPGYLETCFTANLPDKAKARALAAHCLGHFNTPEDAANFIVALDRMPAVSGQVFQLDSRVTRW